MLQTFGINKLGINKLGSKTYGDIVGGFTLILSDGTVLRRRVITGDYLCTDMTITVLGFAGVENTDWETVEYILIEEEMTYLDTISLTGGSEDDITTTIADTFEVYNILLEDTSGNIIEEDITKRVEASGGVWHVFLYSTDPIVDVKLKMIYK